MERNAATRVEPCKAGVNFVLQSDTLHRKVHSAMKPNEAEEHLRVIRSLMEKATIYRAISAPTALVGGLASLAFGIWLYFRWRPLPAGREEEEFERLFIIGWGAVLVVTAVANAFLLWRDAKRRGDRFISSGMKHALLAMLPAMLCGAGLTIFFLEAERPYWLPPMWMLCYGVALLATRAFAPRSIQFLGWAFLATGFATIWQTWVTGWQAVFGNGESHIPTAANLVMTLTFGIFHLIYAALTWPRGRGKV